MVSIAKICHALADYGMVAGKKTLYSIFSVIQRPSFLKAVADLCLWLQNSNKLVTVQELLDESTHHGNESISNGALDRITEWASCGKLPPFSVHQVRTCRSLYMLRDQAVCRLPLPTMICNCVAGGICSIQTAESKALLCCCVGCQHASGRSRADCKNGNV